MTVLELFRLAKFVGAAGFLVVFATASWAQPADPMPVALPPVATAPPVTVRAPEPVAPPPVEPVAAPIPTPVSTQVPLAAVPSADQPLKPGDRLRLLVVGGDDLNREYVVDPQGMISVPWIGVQIVNGRTLAQVEQQIRGLLADGFLVDPKVTLTFADATPVLVETRSENPPPAPGAGPAPPSLGAVRVLGDVTRPGDVALRPGMTLQAVIEAAGGFAPGALQTRAFLRRAGAAFDTPVTVADASLSLQPGDSVRIVKGVVFVLGEVNRVGEYPYTDGMTFQDLVNLAGGMTFRANINDVLVTKAGAKRELRERAAPTMPLAPGDTVRVLVRYF
jgi:polysaccharide export outer membrane protein